MKTQNIKFLVVAAALVAFAGCTKQDPISGGGGTGGGGGGIPHVNQPQVQCYDATPLTLSRKNSAMLCSSSAGPATVTGCYNATPTAITDGQASLLCAGSSTAAPVDCINDNRISAVGNFDAAVLCSYSQNINAPIGCFQNTSLSLYDNEAAVLCQNAPNQNTPNNCYNGTPLSLPEADAATLCSQAPASNDPLVDNGQQALNCYAASPLSLSDSDAAILCQKSVSATKTLECYQNSPTALSDHEAAILCSGASSDQDKSAVYSCYNHSNTNLSNIDAAYMCSGAYFLSNAQQPNTCYADTSITLSEHDAAVLCSANTGLLTSMYSINTQYMNRAVGGRNARDRQVGIGAGPNTTNSIAAYYPGTVDTAETYQQYAPGNHRQFEGSASTRSSRSTWVARSTDNTRVKINEKRSTVSQNVIHNRGVQGQLQARNGAIRLDHANHTTRNPIVNFNEKLEKKSKSSNGF